MPSSIPPNLMSLDNYNKTVKFKKDYSLVILSPLFPQEMVIEHLFKRFIAAPRVLSQVGRKSLG